MLCDEMHMHIGRLRQKLPPSVGERPSHRLPLPAASGPLRVEDLLERDAPGILSALELVGVQAATADQHEIVDLSGCWIRQPQPVEIAD